MGRFDDRYFGHPMYRRRPINDEVRIPLRPANGRVPVKDPMLARMETAESVQAPHHSLQNKTQEQIEKLQAEAAEWKEKYSRLYADQENERKRIERNYATRAGQEKEQVLRDMLPLADNLERALNHEADDDAGLRAGVQLTLKAFTQALAKHGLEPVEAEGKLFDPTIHEAIGALPHPTLPSGTVIKVEETGYTINGKLLRPARVLVAA